MGNVTTDTSFPEGASMKLKTHYYGDIKSIDRSLAIRRIILKEKLIYSKAKRDLFFYILSCFY